QGWNISQKKRASPMAADSGGRAANIHVEPWNLNLFHLLYHIDSKSLMRGENLKHCFILNILTLDELFPEMLNKMFIGIASGRRDPEKISREVIPLRIEL